MGIGTSLCVSNDQSEPIVASRRVKETPSVQAPDLTSTSDARSSTIDSSGDFFPVADQSIDAFGDCRGWLGNGSAEASDDFPRQESVDSDGSGSQAFQDDYIPHNESRENPLVSPTQVRFADRRHRKKQLRKSQRRPRRPLGVELSQEPSISGGEESMDLAMPTDLPSNTCSPRSHSLDRKRWIREAVASGKYIASFSPSASLSTMSRVMESTTVSRALRSPQLVTFS